VKWRKRGLIYAPAGDMWWAREYAHLPTVDVLDDSTLRVYFAGLDAERRGRIGYVDVDARDPNRVLHVSPEPILDIGEAGTFDDSGVNPACVLTAGRSKLLYYIGWQRCERVPYMLFAGRATAEDGECFRDRTRAPVLDRTDEEPFLRSAMSIILEPSVWRAWYVSGLRWITVGGRQYPQYVIRYAESPDGLAWVSRPGICIGPTDDTEFGFGRPWVVKTAVGYEMWYSIRSTVRSYRIGYAVSRDGFTWQRRDDERGIDVASSGWDSEMICYPCVVDVAGRRYLFYNGNGHGATGFGYAELEC
jgi:hypothetical protein